VSGEIGELAQITQCQNLAQRREPRTQSDDCGRCQLDCRSHNQIAAFHKHVKTTSQTTSQRRGRQTDSLCLLDVADVDCSCFHFGPPTHPGMSGFWIGVHCLRNNCLNVMGAGFRRQDLSISQGSVPDLNESPAELGPDPTQMIQTFLGRGWALLI
jgi:hypothetical protein